LLDKRRALTQLWSHHVLWHYERKRWPRLYSRLVSLQTTNFAADGERFDGALGGVVARFQKAMGQIAP